MVLKEIIESGKESTDSASRRNLDPMEFWQQALQNGYTAYFEVKFHLIKSIITMSKLIITGNACIKRT